MATNLPTNFVNDVLSADMGGKRRYTKTDNTDGTISLTDATVYDVEGSTYGATQINATNEAINEISASLDTTNSNLTNNTVTSVYVGTDGKIHVVKAGADSVLNFSGKSKSVTVAFTNHTATSGKAVYWDVTVYVDGVNIGTKSMFISCSSDSTVYPTGNVSFAMNIPQ